MSSSNDSATGRSRKWPKNRHLWSKQRWETVQAHTRFNMYLQLPQRSHRRVSVTVGVTESAVSSTATRDCWGKRAAAYDEYIADQLQKNREKALGEMRERHLKLSMGLQAVGGAGIQEIVKKINNGEKINLSPDQIVKLIEAGSKMERLNRGEPESITQTSSDVHMSATVETIDIRDVMKDKAAYEALKALSSEKTDNKNGN